MRVAINAWCLMSPHTGVASYARNLILALRELEGINLELFYGFSWSQTIRDAPVPGIDSARSIVKKLLPNPYAVNRAVQQIAFTRGVGRLKPDLYHDPSFLPLHFTGPIVVTVHDLSPIRYPQTHPDSRVRAIEKYLPTAVRRAEQIIVDSEFIKNEVVSHFRIDAEKVHAVHLGVTNAYAPRSAGDVTPVLARYGLTYKGYLFAVGTLEPRKNLLQALDAHAALPERARKEAPLVFAGMKGWLAEDLQSRIRAAEERGEVRWLGYVPPEALPALYAGARVFVYPSLYEGFGLPVLEAMASGVPVITSNQASLPEVAGDAALMIDPRDRDGLRDAMLRLLEDDAEVRRLAALGFAQAARFTWRACAEKTLAVYRQAMSNG